MTTMSTTQPQGHRPGRARHPFAGVSGLEPRCGWRGAATAPAFPGRGTTGLVAFPTDAYLGNAITPPAGATGLTMKRTTRLLGTRST